VFKNFYLSSHNGRRLTWQTNMGTADLKAFFGTRKHELNVSTYQMVILLLFKASPEITFRELKENSGTNFFHHSQQRRGQNAHRDRSRQVFLFQS